MILGEASYHPIDDAIQKAQQGKGSKLLAELINAEDRVAPPAAFTDEGIVRKDGRYYWKLDESVEVVPRAEKMSKSRGNVINPDDVVGNYGADSLRLFEMFMGPLEAVKPWSMKGVEGVYRFLSRVWRIFIDDRAEDVRLNDTVQNVEPERESLQVLHRTIERVTGDLDGMRFNTAISAMMEYCNHLTPLKVRPRKALEPFVLLLAPFAPHLAEELWRSLGHTNTLAYEPWPKFDPELVKSDEVEIPIQVNGKLRSKLTVPAGTGEERLKELALADEEVIAFIAGRKVIKIIVPKAQLVNIVVAG
jgi:leucyl-tRNA synthetase